MCLNCRVCHMSYSYFSLFFFQVFFVHVVHAAGTLWFPHCGIIHHIVILRYHSCCLDWELHYSIPGYRSVFVSRLSWRGCVGVCEIGIQWCSSLCNRANWRGLGFLPVLGAFHSFCQHVEAGNDCFPASAQVAAVLETCFYMRWRVGSFTALPASLNSIFI